jgi:hypothetical protein
MGINNRASCRSLFSELEILSLHGIYFEILRLIIKNKIYTTQYSDVHSYNTMYKHNLYVQCCNTNCCKISVINISIEIFNSLPLELKSVTDFKVFKRNLKGYLLHSAFYSLQVFFVNKVD